MLKRKKQQYVLLDFLLPPKIGIKAPVIEAKDIKQITKIEEKLKP